MQRRVIVTGGLLGILVLLAGSTARAQVNPNGWIQTRGWNYVFLCNPLGCGPLTSADMLKNWVAPHSVFAENPKAGTSWNNVDFGGASPATCARDGNLAGGAVFWVTNAFLEATFGLGAGTVPNGDLADWNVVIDDINARVVPLVPTATTISNDFILGLATTYVENTGPPVVIEVCQSSDDAIQTRVNNKLITNVDVCRGESGGCSELTRAVLPSGYSQIQMLVWEEGGGFNGRLGIRIAGSGVNLNDTNGVIIFHGAGAGNNNARGQEQYCLDRTATLAPYNCPNRKVKVTLTGSGAGNDADVLTVEECIRASSHAGILITNVNQGGLVTDKNPTANVLTLLTNRDFIGTDEGGGSSSTLDNPVTHEYTSISTSDGDIWEGCDDFEFHYASVTGDFDVSLCFIDRQNPGGGEWGKFGLMARESLADNSRFTMMQDHLPAIDSARAAGRRGPGGNGCGGGDPFQMFEVGGPIPHPTYIRLTRRGNVVQAWESDNAGLGAGTHSPQDDTHWILVHSEDWGGGAPATLLVGFANSKHDSSDDAAAQTIRYRLLPLTPIGKTVTWIVPRSAVNGGLCYDLEYTETGSTTHVGTAEGLLGIEALAGGLASIAFAPTQSGPVGEFDNSHLIGNPPTPGSTTFDGSGTYTQMSTGADIWDGGDDFHLAYKLVTGDFVATTRFTSVGIQPPVGGSRWGRYGLMARWSCDRNSKYSMACQLGTDVRDDPRHQWRVFHLNNGNTRENYQFNGGVIASTPTAPWVRLVRRGNAIYSYLSDDNGGSPAKWCLMGSDSAPNMPSTLLVGVGSHNHGSAGTNPLVLTFDNFECEPLDTDCCEFEPLRFETAATNTAGTGSVPYTPRIVAARVPIDAADAIAQGGSGLGVKNRNWFWTDLTVGSEDLTGTKQLLWNNENRNFNPDGAGNPAPTTVLLRFLFQQTARVYIAWDNRHVKGGSDNPDGLVNNGWFDFNNDPGTFNAQGWLRIAGRTVVGDGNTSGIATSGDDQFARGGVWCKDVQAGDSIDTYQTGFSGGRSPYVVFIRCGQACSRGPELAFLDYEEAADVGIVVKGGTTPANNGGVAMNGRLLLTEEGPGNQRICVWYGVPYDRGAGGVPLTDDGFFAEWDAFMTRAGVRVDPNANPADGMTFAVIATGFNDGLAHALAPWPPGLDITTLRGSGGGALGYDTGDVNFSIRQRVECHPSIAIEMDNWVGGGEPGNEPADGGSPNFDGKLAHRRRRQRQRLVDPDQRRLRGPEPVAPGHLLGPGSARRVHVPARWRRQGLGDRRGYRGPAAASPAGAVDQSPTAAPG